MFNTLYRWPRTVARRENGPLAESRRRYLEHLTAQGAAIHTIRAAAGVIYRATLMMKLDESSPVERKDVERQNDGLVAGIEMPAAAGRTRPTRNFDRPHATGYGRTAAGIRSSASSSSAGDSRPLSLHGAGLGAFAGNDCDSAPLPEKVLQAYERKTTRPAQDHGCGTISLSRPRNAVPMQSRRCGTVLMVTKAGKYKFYTVSRPGVRTG